MSTAGRLLLSLALAALTAACSTLRSSGPAPLPPEARLDPGRFVVVTVSNDPSSAASPPGSTPRGYDQVGANWISYGAMSAVRGLEHDYGLREASAWPIATLHVQCILFRVPTRTARSRVLAQLGRDRRVESAQPLNAFASQTGAAPTAPVANGSYLRLERNLRELGVIAAHRLSRGAGVRVAVIDTGLDFGHPDLRGRVALRRDFVAGERGFRVDVHGTEVAGVIAAGGTGGAGVLGVAPQARILALKACWPIRAGGARAACDSFTLAQALEAALDERVNIINLSLAGPPDALLTRLVREALRRGIIIVGAVAATHAREQFPGDIAGVLAVASGEDDDAGAGRLLSAPGRDILTLVPGGHYDFASGSSLAAAEVSGVVALLLTSRPGLTPAAVRDILVRSSQRIFTPRGALTTVNACGALAIALSRPDCHPEDAKAALSRPDGSAG